jgi:hypothetical protein
MGIIKEKNLSLHAANFNKKSFGSYIKTHLKNEVFSDFESVTKKTLLSNEVKQYIEVTGRRVPHWNRKLIKIKGKWYNYNDIKSITIKNLLMAYSVENCYLILTDENKESFAAIAGYRF